MRAHTNVRTRFRPLLIAAVVLLFSGAAFAQLRPPRDMTGDWLGEWNDKSERGPDGRGVIGLSFLQVDADGALYGLAKPRDDSYELEIEGVYAMDRRRMAGEVEIRKIASGEVDTFTLTGRCNKKENRIKLKFRRPVGRPIKMKLLKMPSPTVDPTATVTFDLEDFTEISVVSVFNATITQGTDFLVEVTIDEDIVNKLDVTQTGSRLSLNLLFGNNNAATLDAVVTLPVLNRVDVDGVAMVSLNDFNQVQMNVNVGGMSQLRGDSLMISDLTARVSGVSQLDFGDIRPLGNANIDVSGVSKATLNMDIGSTLTGSVTTGKRTGTSSLSYYGTDVTVNVTTDPKSSLTKLGETRP
jgi:hypothetical protein